jgi:hypothetical protein
MKSLIKIAIAHLPIKCEALSSILSTAYVFYLSIHKNASMYIVVLYTNNEHMETKCLTHIKHTMSLTVTPKKMK